MAQVFEYKFFIYDVDNNNATVSIPTFKTEIMKLSMDDGEYHWSEVTPKDAILGNSSKHFSDDDDFIHFRLTSDSGFKFQKVRIKGFWKKNPNDWGNSSEMLPDVDGGVNLTFKFKRDKYTKFELWAYILASDEIAEEITTIKNTNENVQLTATHNGVTVDITNTDTEITLAVDDNGESNITLNYSVENAYKMETANINLDGVVSSMDIGNGKNGVHTYNSKGIVNAITDFTIIEDIPIDPIIPKKQSIDNSYIIEDDVLKNIRKMAFTSDSGSNPLTYVTNILLLPFKIDDEYVLNEQKIVVKNIELDYTGLKLKYNECVLPLGIIKFNTKYGNGLDIFNTNIKLYIPFIADIIELSPSEVMGKSVKLEMIVHLITGETTLNIHHIENGYLLLSRKVLIGQDYSLMAVEYKDDKPSTVKGVINNINTPYAVIERSKYLNSGETILTRKIGIIGDEKGFIQVTQIHLDCKGLLDDKIKIESLLKDGIFIL